MDTGDWRYGRGSDGAPWTEPSTGSPPSPDLWADEESDTSGWASAQSWRPRHQADTSDSSPISPSPIGSAPTSPSVTGNGSYESPVTGFPSGGYPIPGFSSGYTAAHPAPRYGVPPATPEPSTYGGSTYDAPAYEESSYRGSSYGGTTYGDESAYGSATSSGAAYGASFGTAPSSGAAYGAAGRTYGAAPSYGTPSPFSQTVSQTARRPTTVASRLASSGRRDSGDEPATGGYLRVFGYTAIWYAGPLVLYLLWLVVFGGDREAVAGRMFVDGIPWMLGAVVVSAGLALLLRRVTVGWGTVGVSFAATVIGAGLATIVHSFA